MDLGTVTASVVVLLLGCLWYGLQIMALRDLQRRPRVRGDNKVLWAIAIFCVPYIGALAYLVAGPTSFLPREDDLIAADSARRSTMRHFPAVPTLQSTVIEAPNEPLDPFKKNQAEVRPRATPRPSPTVTLPRHKSSRPQPKPASQTMVRPRVATRSTVIPTANHPDDEWDGVTTLPPLPEFPGEEAHVQELPAQKSQSPE